VNALRRTLALVALAWLAASLAGVSAPAAAGSGASRARGTASRRPAGPAPVPGGRLGGFADSGAFLRFYHEQTWGTVGFTWRPDGSLESRTLRGRPATRADLIRIEPDAGGEWTRVWLGVSRDSAIVERFGSRAVLRAEGRVDTLELEPGTLLDGTPALLSQVPRAYDRSRGGVQRMPVLILPMHQVQGTVARLGTATRTVGGRSQRFERWRYEVPGSRYILWTDGKGRVCYADDSTEAFGFVRVGFEALRGPRAKEPAAPKER
jgi:hypothetical protein